MALYRGPGLCTKKSPLSNRLGLAICENMNTANVCFSGYMWELHMSGSRGFLVWMAPNPRVCNPRASTSYKNQLKDRKAGKLPSQVQASGDTPGLGTRVASMVKVVVRVVFRGARGLVGMPTQQTAYNPNDEEAVQKPAATTEKQPPLPQSCRSCRSRSMSRSRSSSATQLSVWAACRRSPDTPPSPALTNLWLETVNVHPRRRKPGWPASSHPFARHI